MANPQIEHKTITGKTLVVEFDDYGLTVSVQGCRELVCVDAGEEYAEEGVAARMFVFDEDQETILVEHDITETLCKSP